MTEQKALQQLKKQDPAALAYFIDHYTPYVSTVIWNIISRRMSAQDVEELCSDVFLALWQTAGNIRTPSVKAYLGSIARYKAISRLRKQGWDVELDEDILSLPGEGLEQLVERRERDELVRQSVQAMEQPDRDIFVRYYYYCQSTTDIAKEMGISPASVRQRLHRGRERLRQKLIEGGIADELSNF
jgi:RNA polymerase sigma-70 factor (ECF subfamily)